MKKNDINYDALRAEYVKVWGMNDKGMVDYEMREQSHAVRLSDGTFYVVPKMKIRKQFGFGYDTDYTGHECSDAAEREDKFMKDNSAFIKANLEPLDAEVDRFMKKDREGKAVYAVPAYNRGNGAISHVLVTWPDEMHTYHDGFTKEKDCHMLTRQDVAKILLCLRMERHDFLKRLNTYLKKYGMSKVKTYTYWKDL